MIRDVGHPAAPNAMGSLQALVFVGVDHRHRFRWNQRVVYAGDGRMPGGVGQGIYDLKLVVNGGGARSAAVGLTTGDHAAARGWVRELGQQIVRVRA